jgi:hypothetical protein
MAAERIHAVAKRYREYLRKKTEQGDRRTRKVFTPLEAVTFDRVELTSPRQNAENDYQWLTAYTKGLSDEEVSLKMRQYRDSFPTIDEAFIDKLQMELL